MHFVLAKPYNSPLLGGVVFFILLLITRGFNYPCCVLPSQMRAMKTMLLQVTSRFHELNHTYVLGEGTLLGIVRDGDLIRWDTDIDIHLPACQDTMDLFLHDKFLKKFQPLPDNGCQVKNVKVYHPRSFYQNAGLKPLYKKLYVELSFHGNNSKWANRSRISGFGFSFFGPFDAHRVLQNEYGMDYLNPIKGEDGGAGTNQFSGICPLIVLFFEFAVFLTACISCFYKNGRFYNGVKQCIAILLIPVTLLFLLLCFIELAVPYE